MNLVDKDVTRVKGLVGGGHDKKVIVSRHSSSFPILISYTNEYKLFFWVSFVDETRIIKFY